MPLKKKTRLHYHHQEWKREYRDCDAKVGSPRLDYNSCQKLAKFSLLESGNCNTMTGQLLKIAFSEARLERYFNCYKGNEEKAVELYKANQELSEALYTSLMTLELVLRNSIHRELTTHYGREDWYEEFDVPSMQELYNEIIKVKSRLSKARKKEMPARIVSELTFGFWTSLFNSTYEKELWKPLRFVFQHLLKSERQRRRVSTPLNQIRSLRNRTHHYEHIMWNPVTKVLDLQWLSLQHAEIYEVMEWMNPEIAAWAKAQDRFESVLKRIQMTHNPVAFNS